MDELNKPEALGQIDAALLRIIDTISAALIVVASIALMLMMVHVSADVVGKFVFSQPIPMTLETETTTEETAVITRRIAEVMKDNLDERIPLMKTLAGLAQRIEIEPGKIKVAICGSALAELLEVERERISDDFLEVESAFQHRKRGVETKLTLANETHPRDETLIKNLAKAHRYFEQIRSGQTYADIAVTEGVSKHRIQKLLDLAFLAPDVVRDAFAGAQPPGLTTERLLRNAIPSSWAQQRDLFRSF